MPGETVTTVVRTIREQREKFETFCRSLSEEELRRPVPESTWIVKDFVSHLGSLDPTTSRLRWPAGTRGMTQVCPYIWASTQATSSVRRTTSMAGR